MSLIRRLVLWVAIRVPLGRLSPRLVGFGLKSKPKPDNEEKGGP